MNTCCGIRTRLKKFQLFVHILCHSSMFPKLHFSFILLIKLLEWYILKPVKNAFVVGLVLFWFGWVAFFPLSFIYIQVITITCQQPHTFVLVQLKGVRGLAVNLEADGRRKGRYLKSILYMCTISKDTISNQWTLGTLHEEYFGLYLYNLWFFLQWFHVRSLHKGSLDYFTQFMLLNLSCR